MLSIKPSNLYNYKYTAKDTSPVKIESISKLSSTELNNITQKYNQAGFVVYEVLNHNSEQDIILELAKQLNLGQPFVPKTYRTSKHMYEETGLNTIKVSDGNHRAFQTNNGQKIHCDGTIEEINKVKTSILHCNISSINGGETIIFNSVGAFYNLLKTSNYTSIMSSMLNNIALKRDALNETADTYIGPAFKIENGELISRFSLDNTCDWNYSFEKIAGLEEALKLLQEMITLESPYYIETKLRDNQGIIMANNKISHGRKSFDDEGTRKREMIRGLFLNNL